MLFDLAYVPMPGESSASAAEITRHIRRIGIKRFVFGSDFNVLTPAREVKNLRRLGLSAEEWLSLEENCAPWAC